MKYSKFIKTMNIFFHSIKLGHLIVAVLLGLLFGEAAMAQVEAGNDIWVIQELPK